MGKKGEEKKERSKKEIDFIILRYNLEMYNWIKIFKESVACF